MSQSMMALMVTEWGRKAELREIARPTITADEVLVQVGYSGVSVGTEMWIASGKRKDCGEVPFVNGYQATGRIVEVGAKVTNVAVGDQVAAFCAGYASHAEYVKTPAQFVHKLPNPDIAKWASLFVQPCVGANAINQAEIGMGDTVLVIGQGLIGQATAQLARLRGAHVIASDVSPERLAVSARHCADWTIDVSKLSLVEEIKKRYPDGVDVVIETTGFAKLLDDAFRCVKSHGRFVFEGWYPDAVSFTFQLAHSKQVRAFFPCFIGSPPVREGVLQLMASGNLQIEPLISHCVSWKQSAEVYNLLFTPERNRLNGVVFDWSH
ncbi:MAG: zinc-binding alcohol dehydrogenase [Planctomycetota bacterium]